MKKPSYSLYRTLFEEAPPEAPKDEVFGQWLFPKERGLDVTEPDTDAENNFRKALDDFLGPENDVKTLTPWIPLLKKIMTKHEYSLVTDPGHVDVYRGIGLEIDATVKFLQGIGFKVDQATWDKTPEDDYYKTFQHSFSLKPLPNRMIQSWSTDVATAKSFAGYTGDLAMIFKANTQNSVFFGKPGDLAKAAGSPFANEGETISLGAVEVDSIMISTTNEEMTAKLLQGLNGTTPPAQPT